MKSLQQQFKNVSKIENKSRRGRAFEDLLFELFKQHGFKVAKNAKSAKPRQTDLVVESAEHSIVIEAKWQKKNIDIDDIDNLRSRLRRVPTDFIGAIFSLSNIGIPAVRAVEEDITREILLFGPDEVEAIFHDKAHLVELIERKKHELRIKRAAWFFQPTVKSTSMHKLPSGRNRFYFSGKGKACIESRSDHSNILFSNEILDDPFGSGVSLDLNLSINSEEQLRNLLTLIEKRFGLTNNGSFSIHQLTNSWFGIGAENFVKEVSRWKSRYKSAKIENPHHSEDLSYLDVFQDGWLLLTLRQSISEKVHKDLRIHSGRLIIQLSGVPVDMTAFLQFCRETNNPYARFCIINDREFYSAKVKNPIRLDVKGNLIQTTKTMNGQESYIIGIVARNPFFKSAKLSHELTKDSSAPFRVLHAVEFIICHLKDWHKVGDKVDKYYMLGVQGRPEGSEFVIYLFGTWGKIISRE